MLTYMRTVFLFAFIIVKTIKTFICIYFPIYILTCLRSEGGQAAVIANNRHMFKIANDRHILNIDHVIMCILYQLFMVVI